MTDHFTKFVKLIAPAGTDECNYNETRFKVHEDGTVDVPEEAVEALCKVGGFYLAPVAEIPIAADSPFSASNGQAEGGQ